MKLAFQLLVVDDQPDDGLRSAIQILREYLDNKGFDLVPNYLLALSGTDWDAVQNQSRSYDLVMVDYNLSQSEMGDVAARRLRTALPYTDIIFYSAGKPRTELLRLLADQQVEGVFVARRQELDDPLVGLADAVIGKAVDLNHTRGIAMAEVAEMDLLLKKLLVDVFQYPVHHASKVGQKSAKDIKKNIDKDSDEIQKYIDADNILDLVKQDRIFSLSWKHRMLVRLTRQLPKNSLSSDTSEILKSFNNEIIDMRNTLAHIQEDSDKDGNVILRSTKGDGNPVTINDAWMADCRQSLRQHRSVLETVCDAIRRNFVHVNSPDDSEKDQS